MWSSLLYQYIISPAQTLRTRPSQYPIMLFIVSIILMAMARLPLITFEIYSYPLALVFLMLFYVVLMFFLSIVIDFVAQLFRLPAQSLKLFFWFGITLVPFILTVPLQLLEFVFPDFYTIFATMELSCFLLCIA